MLRALNFSSSSSSCAKILTMRLPTTFSSAAAVTSAIFCCTSRSTGCRRRLKRMVTITRKGRNAREISASPGEMTNSSTTTAAMVKKLAVKKISP